MKDIPNYILYGEKDRALFTEYLHIESIRARSLDHGWKFRPHRHHNLHQFFFILEGGGQALIDGKTYGITANMLLGIPPSTIHGFHFLPDTSGWVLSIPDLYLQNILKNNLLLLKHISQKIICPCDGDDVREELSYLFTALQAEQEQMASSHDLALRSLAALLVTRIARLQPPAEKPSGEATSQKHILLRRFQNLVNLRFRERLSVADHARELGITPTHLNRICRECLDISASGLIHERSLLEAKRLLIYTSRTIADIAYELGFADPTHFSKFFHSKCRQKPSGFRKQYMRLV